METAEELQDFLNTREREVNRLFLKKSAESVGAIVYIATTSYQEFIGKLLVDDGTFLLVEHPCEIITTVYFDQELEEETTTYSLEKAFKHSKHHMHAFKHIHILSSGLADEEIKIEYLKYYGDKLKETALKYDSNGDERPSPNVRIKELIGEGKMINLQDFISNVKH